MQRGRMWRQGLGVGSWLLAMGVLSISGRASCEAKCVGPSVRITVSVEVETIRVCDSSDRCAEQSFGQPGPLTTGRSIDVAVAGEGRDVTVTVSGTTFTGEQIAASTVTARGTEAACDCVGPALMSFGPEGAHAIQDD